MNKPQAGKVGQAFSLSQERKISETSSGANFPLPT